MTWGLRGSDERRDAYIATVPVVYEDWKRLGIRWALSADYPDYYPDKPGGMDGGRAIETEPFDSKRLGSWFSSSRARLPVPIKTDDVWLLTRAWSSRDGFWRGAQFVGRTLRGVVTGKKYYGFGGAYTGHLMATAKDLGVEVRLRTPITGVVKDDAGVVVGAEVATPAGTKRIGTRAGVMLGTGGFARNKEWRREHHGIDGYTSAPEGDLGTGIQVGIDAGADLALMDDAWWGASILMPDGEAQFSVNERSDPYSIIVDQSGQRFCNESASLHRCRSRHPRARQDGAGHPFVDAHRAPSRPQVPQQRRHPGAREGSRRAAPWSRRTGSKSWRPRLGMDWDVLRATVERFNGFCRTGVDEDFERGRTAYDNYYGDPSLKNPNLGPLEKGPFRAFKIVPGDLGTKGGLLTDEHARVLSTDGVPIEGLYAAGNTTASVMGRTYPGAGSTIGPATVFGYLGAKHAARRLTPSLT
ncbi:FAD-binding protein [Demequina litorisediminis]|uniref:3-oxosteroid 1-dehydrogenase n=1 Tax=Demequina litorisediminis TaxID=1849022 RepID=A0ABQ6IA93_9MICO|nr:FAD-binding protein [Demequina litorisediminis]GMA34631.1 3-oxosteroid 1-dehydrogenase [Demequina litorisediminis]